MAASFFFYDLETSGINPRTARIMQFAGQRTDLDLNPVGEPINVLIKLSDDILPEPDAIMITGITPQQTIADGITEAEFVKLFDKEINKPETTFVGYNSVRFDDEFMRCLFYRNFYDSYEWHWKNKSSRWDMLDVVRMTRALRPEGIEWPFASDGKPSNRLELLTAVNKLAHDDAHDALSDVTATIDVAKLIKQKQPKLFEYLYSLRGKKEVEKLATAGQPFVYVSGRYDADHEKLTIVHRIGGHPERPGSLVYDLRHDPSSYLAMSPEELAGVWRWTKDKDADRLPVKLLQYNRCPAVAPLGVIRPEDMERLYIDMAQIMANKKLVDSDSGFIERLHKALVILGKDREQTTLITDNTTVDGQIYDSFASDGDRQMYAEIRRAEPSTIGEFAAKLADKRLKVLLPLYKARNFPKDLNPEERQAWEAHRSVMLQKSMPKFIERLSKLSEQSPTGNQEYLIEELRLYAESIMPGDEL